MGGAWTHCPVECGVSGIRAAPQHPEKGEEGLSLLLELWDDLDLEAQPRDRVNPEAWFYLFLASPNFLFLRGWRAGGTGGVKSLIKRLQMLLGYQRALTKLHFDELRVNESETYGFHFLRNTQGFRNEEVGEDLARGVWALAKMLKGGGGGQGSFRHVSSDIC